MPDPDDKLADQWAKNEEELQRLSDLPAGPVDPAERERQLDREQDRLEGEAARAWYQRKSEERIAAYGASLMRQMTEALSHALCREVTAHEVAKAVGLLERAMGSDLDLSKPEAMLRLLHALRR